MKINTYNFPRRRRWQLLFGSLGVVIYTLLLFALVYFESVHPEARIQNLGDAFWFSIVTITTVGYGDYYPVTFEGRFIGLFYIFLSLIVLGYLISKISNFIIMLSENKKYGLNGTKFKDHIVIIGWDRLTQKIVDSFSGMDLKFALISNNKEDVQLLNQKYPDEKVFGLYTPEYSDVDILELANIRQSRTVFVNFSNDTEKLAYLLNLHKKYGKLNFMAMIEHDDLAETFESIGVDFVVSRDLVAMNLLTDYMFCPQERGASLFISQSDEFGTNYRTKQYTLEKDSELSGQTFDKAMLWLKENHNCIPISLIRENKLHKMVFKNPDTTTVLKPGDRLITISD